jgi:mannose-6-phosphate isomerase-like protein (cupin superfamily)
MAKLVKVAICDKFQKPRGWGWEYWLENMPEYCAKVLHVFKGKRGSLHFHKDKKETMMLSKGYVQLRMVDPETGSEYSIYLEHVGDSVTIPPAQVHQIIGLEESEIVEFSTIHDEKDSYRVQKGD